MKPLAALICAGLLSGCAMLDRELDLVGPEGEVVTKTVGEVIAESAEPAGNTVGTIASTLSGNPMIGGGAAALTAALLGGLARKRKKVVPEVEEPAA